MDFNETCVRTRGRKNSAFVLSNHFATNSLGLPEEDIAEEVNMAVNIRNRTDVCTEMLERQTNLLSVDYWSVGDTLQVVQEYNEALPDITQSPSMSPIPSASPTGMPTLSASPTVAPIVQPTTAPPVEEPTVVDVVDEVTPVPTTFLEGLTGPTPQVADPFGESLSPSSEVMDTSVPTGTQTEWPVAFATTASPAPILAAPVAQGGDTSTTGEPSVAPVVVDTPIPTFAPSSFSGGEADFDSPTSSRNEDSHVLKHFFIHNNDVGLP